MQFVLIDAFSSVLHTVAAAYHKKTSTDNNVLDSVMRSYL